MKILTIIFRQKHGKPIKIFVWNQKSKDKAPQLFSGRLYPFYKKYGVISMPSKSAWTNLHGKAWKNRFSDFLFGLGSPVSCQIA
jgi:hypothetical protein